MKKAFLAIGVLIIALVIFIAYGLLQARRHPAVRVALPDGTTVRVAAVTIGGNQNHPGSKILGTILGGLPGQWQQKIWEWSDYRLYWGNFLYVYDPTRTNDLVLFLSRQTNAAGTAMPPGAYYTAFLSDESNFISGEEQNIFMWSTYSSPAVVGPVNFKVYPHRSKQIAIHFFYHPPAGTVSECGSLTFANPKFQNYPKWAAEKLPATKQVDDLGVTLVSVNTGFNYHTSATATRDGRMVTTHGTNRMDGRNETAVEVKLQPVDTNEAWQVTSVEVSDATSNRIMSTSMNWNGNSDNFSFEPVLWPDEAAWKLKFFLKRTKGFKPEELLVFKSVPLGETNQTNFLNWQTNFGGASVTLRYFVRRMSSTGPSWNSSQLSEVMVTNSVLTNGMYLDLLGAVFEPGKTNGNVSSSWSDTERTHYFRDVPAEAKTGDFIYALHKGRTVEFTVKPELPRAEQMMPEH